MILELIFLTQVSTLVSSQCMSLDERRDNVRESHQDQFIVMNSTSLIGCIDECLTDSIQTCKKMVFNQARNTCTVVNGFMANRCRGCVAMEKLNCRHRIVDFQCFHTVYYSYKDMTYLYGLESERECRQICIISYDCSAYSWLQRIQKCGLLSNHYGSTQRLKEGEISARKQRNCFSNRCTLIKFKAMAFGVRKRFAVSSMFKCYQKLIQSNRIKAVEWQYEKHVCYLLSGKVTSVNLSFKKAILVLSQQPCKGKPGVCAEKRSNRNMEGGSVIANTDEQDSVTLCLHSVNCVAVTWSRDRICRFHHVMRKMTDNSNFTNYAIVQCKNDLSPSEESTTECVWHGFEAGSKTESSYCFKCAAQCHIRTCSSFTCQSQQGQGEGHHQCQLHFDDVTGHGNDPGN